MSDILEWTAQLPEVMFPAGAELRSEGNVDGSMLVLVEGTVEVFKYGELVTTIDEPGSIFGEMSALLGGTTRATLRAATDCRLRRCDDPPGFLAEHPRVALTVAVTLARRLETITDYLVDLRHQYADRSDHLGMVETVLTSLATHHGPAVEPGSEREPEAPY